MIGRMEDGARARAVAWRAPRRVGGAAAWLAGACAVAGAALLGAAPLAAPLAAQARGALVIVGGGPQPDAVRAEFVRLAGGAGKARIIVFAMASEEGRTSGEETVAELAKHGASARNVYLTREDALTDSAGRLLDGATGVWFGGGDQVRLANVLKGTPVERAIHARFAAGAVIGGTSAGAAVMSRVMITGDERRPGGIRPDSEVVWGTMERDNVITAEGFGLLPDAIVDQHFFRRKRYGRLLTLVVEREPHLGVGIDESTALIVGADGHWRVAGESGAVIYDARRATRAAGGRQVQASGVTVHVLTAGGTFDPRTGRVALGTP